MKEIVYRFNLGVERSIRKKIYLKSFTIQLGSETFHIKDRASALRCKMLGVLQVDEIITNYDDKIYTEIIIGFDPRYVKASIWDITECKFFDEEFNSNIAVVHMIYDFKADINGRGKGEFPWFLK